MSVSLQQALSNHRIASFDQIGVSKWTYLSYDSTNGWGVVKFEGICGFFQQFFRWLGCYGSTHLKTVARAIAAEPNVSAALLTKVQTSWQKAYPKEAFPTAPSQQQQAQGTSQPVELAFKMVGRTRVSIEVGDITKLRNVDAIVNAANLELSPGQGVCGAIYRAAGEAPFVECRRFSKQDVGQAVRTGAGNLIAQGIQGIIHAIGPNMHLKPKNPDQRLETAYGESLDRAWSAGYKTIAFPSISTGLYGFDFERGTRIALQVIHKLEKPDHFDAIRLIFLEQNLGQRAAQMLREYRE